jgi:hypothetical protein
MYFDRDCDFCLTERSSDYIGQFNRSLIHSDCEICQPNCSNPNEVAYSDITV